MTPDDFDILALTINTAGPVILHPKALADLAWLKNQVMGHKGSRRRHGRGQARCQAQNSCNPYKG